MAESKPRNLSTKQEAFCIEYIKDFNGSRAARDAGYSKRTAYAAANKLLKDKRIQDRVKDEIAKRSMSADEVIMRLTEIARGSAETFLTFTEKAWKIDLLKAHEAGKIHLIKSIAPGKFGIEIKMHDPLQALELIGKSHSLFKDHQQVEVLHVDGLAKILDKVYGRTDSEPGNP